MESNKKILSAKCKGFHCPKSKPKDRCNHASNGPLEKRSRRRASRRTFAVGTFSSSISPQTQIALNSLDSPITCSTNSIVSGLTSKKWVVDWEEEWLTLPISQ